MLSRADFVARHPRLYHIAAGGSWPSLAERGLLSTSALLDLFEVDAVTRRALERECRVKQETLEHPVHGRVVLRDQRPMLPERLGPCLRGGITPEDWYHEINRRVFFWPTDEDRNTFLNARAYRKQPKLLLTIDTAALLERHAARVELSRINSGSTHPMPSPRGLDDFITLDRYLSEGGYRGHSPRTHFRELTVLGGVPDLAAVVLRAEEYLPGEAPRTLHTQS
ncbi:MAG TPA: hypothetical protein VGB85_02970 [Nannocystis sp.]|jgi:hypothetical protein